MSGSPLRTASSHLANGFLRPFPRYHESWCRPSIVCLPRCRKREWTPSGEATVTVYSFASLANRMLCHIPATIDTNHLTSNIGGLVRNEKRHEMGDFLWKARPPQGYVRQDTVHKSTSGTISLDEAKSHRVDGDLLR